MSGLFKVKRNPQMGQPHLKVSRHQLFVLKPMMPGLGLNSRATLVLVILTETIGQEEPD